MGRLIPFLLISYKTSQKTSITILWSYGKQIHIVKTNYVIWKHFYCVFKNMDINFLALTHFNKLFLILNRFLWFLYIMELVFFLIFTFFVHRWAASDILAQDKQAFLPIENKTCLSYKIKKWLIIIKTVHSVLNSHQENLAGKGCSISQWNWQNWYFSSFIGGRLTYYLIGKP